MKDSQIDTFVKEQAQKAKPQKDLFDVDEETKFGDHYEEEEEDELDMNQVEPHKVNWFKYIIDRYLQLEDDEGNPSALNNPDAFLNLLNIILSNKRNEEIQEELLDLVGFQNLELLEQLLDKRELIKEHCKNVNEKLMQEKQQTDSYRPKNMGLPAVSIGVRVEKGKEKGKKRKGPVLIESEKVSNYDLLKRLGFDKDMIEQNRRGGAKER